MSERRSLWVVVAVVLVMAGMAGSASATTVTVRPTALDSGHSCVGEEGCTDQIDCINDNSDSSYIRCYSPATNDFWIDAFQDPGDLGTINSMTLYVRYRAPDGTDDNGCYGYTNQTTGGEPGNVGDDGTSGDTTEWNTTNICLSTVTTSFQTYSYTIAGVNWTTLPPLDVKLKRSAVAAGDETQIADVWIEVDYTSNVPTITSFAPSESEPQSLPGKPFSFNITVSQTVDVTWYMNGTNLTANYTQGVTQAWYNNSSAEIGTWNITAVASNANGTDTQTWIWTVSYAEKATYDSSLGAPRCTTGYSPCIAGSSLLEGRDGNPPEPNQPNTIDDCTDTGGGAATTYVYNITITDLNRSRFAPGDTIQVEAWFDCYDNTNDASFVYTNSTSSIDWVAKASFTLAGSVCGGSGVYKKTVTWKLDNNTGTHAVRVLTSDSTTSLTCANGDYNDNDDVAFEVSAAGDGSGVASISPATATRGIFDTFNITYTAADTFDNGNVTIEIPADWTPPSLTLGDDGYTTVAAGTGVTLGSPTITGSGPWTIDIPVVAMELDETFTVTYGNTSGNGNGSRPNASAPLGANIFTTKSKVESGGTLTNLTSSPVVSVSAPGDGSGFASISPASVFKDFFDTFEITYTAADNFDNGTVSITVPAGWTAPSLTAGEDGYTTVVAGIGAPILGELAVSGQNITVNVTNMTYKDTFKVTYGDTAGGGSGAKPTSSAATGTNTFTTKSQLNSSGTLTEISSSPTVNVLEPLDNVVIADISSKSGFSSGQGRYIMLYNPRSVYVNISGWKIDDSAYKDPGDSDGTLTFPNVSEANMSPNSKLYIADDWDEFNQEFGFKPDFEWEPTTDDTSIPNMIVGGSFTIRAAGEDIRLMNGSAVVDAIIFGTSGVTIPNPSLGWEDSSTVPLKDEKWEVLHRVKDETTGFYVDSNKSSDWTHIRSYFAGYSDFPYQTFEFEGNVTVFTAPDSIYNAMVAEINNSTQSLYAYIYYIKVMYLANPLIDAKNRGVDVKVAMEGNPGGHGDPVLAEPSESAQYVCRELAEALGACKFIGTTDVTEGYFFRYNYDHAKYMVIDNKSVFISANNWNAPGTPKTPTAGSRGWAIIIRNESVAEYYRDVFLEAYDLDVYDVKNWDAYGGPYTEDTSDPSGSYVPLFESKTIEGTFKVTPIIGPDHTTLEKASIKGMIDDASDTVFIEQMTLMKDWYFGLWGIDRPNEHLEAAIDAARRGATVRMLIDPKYDYDLEVETIDYVNGIASSENLDMRAKFIDLGPLSLLHNKGVIADNKTLVSSVNWNYNAIANNRETGVIVENDDVARYYTEIFNYDWNMPLDIIINEVYPNPTNSEGSAGEWIEIYNQNNTSFDLTGWTLSDQDGNTFTFPSGFEINSTNRYVVIHTGSGTNTNTDLYWGLGSGVWDDGGDDVLLRNDSGVGIDYVTYGSGSEVDDVPTDLIWLKVGESNPLAPIKGQSLGRDSSSTDTDYSDDWESTGGEDANGPTPCAQNIGAGADQTAPTWQNVASNISTVEEGRSINLTAQGKDETALWYAILSTNETGTWQNWSGKYGSPIFMNYATGWKWSNFTWQNSSVKVGSTVEWRIWYNDTSNNWNATSIKTFTVRGLSVSKLEAPPSTYKGFNFTVNASVFNNFSTSAPNVNATINLPSEWMILENKTQLNSSVGADEIWDVNWTVNATTCGQNYEINVTANATVYGVLREHVNTTTIYISCDKVGISSSVSPSEVEPGNSTVFSIIVTNYDSQAITDVYVNITIPSGWTSNESSKYLASMAAKTSSNFDFLVTSSGIALGSYELKADVNYTDPALQSQSDSTTSTLRVGTPQIEITRDMPSLVGLSRTVIVKFIVKNIGNATAYNVVFRETIPENWTDIDPSPTGGDLSGNVITWNLGNLGINDDKYRYYYVKSPASPENVTFESNASYENANGTSRLVNESFDVEVKSTGAYYFQFSIDKVSVYPNNTTQFTLNITNVGNEEIYEGSNISLRIPTGWNVNETSVTNENGTWNAPYINWTINESIPPDTSRLRNFTANTTSAVPRTDYFRASGVGKSIDGSGQSDKLNNSTSYQGSGADTHTYNAHDFNNSLGDKVPADTTNRFLGWIEVKVTTDGATSNSRIYIDKDDSFGNGDYCLIGVVDVSGATTITLNKSLLLCTYTYTMNTSVLNTTYYLDIYTDSSTTVTITSVTHRWNYSILRSIQNEQNLSVTVLAPNLTISHNNTTYSGTPGNYVDVSITIKNENDATDNMTTLILTEKINETLANVSDVVWISNGTFTSAEKYTSNNTIRWSGLSILEPGGKTTVQFSLLVNSSVSGDFPCGLNASIEGNDTGDVNTYVEWSCANVSVTGDISPPSFSSPGMNATSILLNESIELWINVMDNVGVSLVIFNLTCTNCVYPNGTSVNWTQNLSASLKNGSSQAGYWNYTFDSTGKPTGEYTWKAYARDTAGNLESNDTGKSFKVEVRRNVSFVSGYNVISLLLDEWSTVTADSFGTSISGIRAISMWDRDNQRWIDRIFKGGSPVAGDNFVMRLGHGFFIKTDEPSTITRSGKVLPPAVNVLKPQWNLIGIRKNSTRGEICAVIGNCTEFWEWNSTINWYDENYDKYVPEAPNTNNLSVIVGAAYWVYANNTTYWNW